MIDNFGWRLVLGLCKEYMDVIANGIDFNEGRIEIFENAGYIRVEVPTFLVADKLTPTFGAEHKMDDNIR